MRYNLIEIIPQKTVFYGRKNKEHLNTYTTKLVSKIEEKETYSFTLVYTPDEESVKKESEKGCAECVQECD